MNKVLNEYVTLKIYYRKEHRYFDVLIDAEDLEKIKDKKIQINFDDEYYRAVIFNGKYYKSLQSYLTPNIKHSYCKNKNYCDCRKENITASALDVDGLVESRALKIKESSLKMSKEKRENIARGARENRYTKDYSNKLQADKLGEKNISVVLTWDLVNEIRNISRNEDTSQYTLAEMFNVGRATIADIINYRTWTIKPELNERVYKDSNIKLVKEIKQQDLYIEFDYNDITFDNMLLEFEDEYLYIEKLSTEGLVYIEQRNIEGKCLASADVYIPKHKSKLMKKFYSIAKMNPKSKGRDYFYKLIDKAFKQVKFTLNH